MVRISILGICLALSMVLSAQALESPGIPKGARGENVTETSFTACWDAVEGAD